MPGSLQCLRKPVSLSTGSEIIGMAVTMLQSKPPRLIQTIGMDQWFCYIFYTSWHWSLQSWTLSIHGEIWPQNKKHNIQSRQWKLQVYGQRSRDWKNSSYKKHWPYSSFETIPARNIASCTCSNWRETHKPDMFQFRRVPTSPSEVVQRRTVTIAWINNDPRSKQRWTKLEHTKYSSTEKQRRSYL